MYLAGYFLVMVAVLLFIGFGQWSRRPPRQKAKAYVPMPTTHEYIERERQRYEEAKALAMSLEIGPAELDALLDELERRHLWNVDKIL